MFTSASLCTTLPTSFLRPQITIYTSKPNMLLEVGVGQLIAVPQAVAKYPNQCTTRNHPICSVSVRLNIIKHDKLLELGDIGPSFRQKWLACWPLVPESQARILLSTDIFLPPLSKCSESRGGYCSTIKMPAVKVSWNFFKYANSYTYLTQFSTCHPNVHYFT